MFSFHKFSSFKTKYSKQKQKQIETETLLSIVYRISFE